jgi:predicted nucleic acid-binding protein
VALRYLVDKSALARLRHAKVAARLTPMIVAGDVAVCGVIELEVLFSAKNLADFTATRGELAGMPRLEIEEADFERAADVLHLLCRAGRHRAASIPDLIIAAVAERANVAVMHYDKDFDLIARATGQRVEWVAAAGSVP